jgi:hypothetical protein
MTDQLQNGNTPSSDYQEGSRPHGMDVPKPRAGFENLISFTQTMRFFNCLGFGRNGKVNIALGWPNEHYSYLEGTRWGLSGEVDLRDSLQYGKHEPTNKKWPRLHSLHYQDKNKPEGEWRQIFLQTAEFDGIGICNVNVKRRRAYFAEVDGADLKTQVEAIEWLEQRGLIVNALVFSGGKSIHVHITKPISWVTTEEEDLIIGKLLAVLLGGDPSVIDARRLSRLPGFDRPGKAPQTLLGGTEEVHNSYVELRQILESALIEKGISDLDEAFAQLRTKQGGRTVRTAAEKKGTCEMAEEWQNWEEHGGWTENECRIRRSYNLKLSASQLLEFLPQKIKQLILDGSPEGSRNDDGMKVTLSLRGAVNVLEDLGFELEDQVQEVLNIFIEASGDDIDVDRLLNQYEGAGAATPGIPVENFLNTLYYETQEFLGKRKEKLSPKDCGPQEDDRPSGLGRQEFTVLGWDSERHYIYYQKSGIGQIARIKPWGCSELLKMAPLSHWQEHFADRPTRQNQNAIPDWTLAASHLIETANLFGVYNTDRTRGLGVWIDDERVVWHLGNRLEVDGCLMPLEALQGRNYYARLPELPIDTSVKELSDSEGIAILEILKEMAWQGQNDAINFAGWIVISNIGGALEKRPGLQLTSSTGSGKGDCIDHVIRPLQAELGVYTSGSTEAGLRQLQKHNCLPALIDESEQEDARKREKQLLLVRYSYDGMEHLKGTQVGIAHSFTIRFPICLVGINAEIPKPADRNRIVVVGRRQMSPEEWNALVKLRAEVITVERGRRLIRRTVTHAKTLLHNIEVFAKILKCDYSGREGDTYGPILAGAYFLGSTKKVDEESARAWIQAHGWSLDPENRAECSAINEAEKCIEHILGHEVRCNDSGIAPNGLAAIRELVALSIEKCFGDPHHNMVKTLLGRYGLKVDHEKGLLIATGARGMLPQIFAGTPWANGAYKRRLEDIPGVNGKAGSFHVPTLGTQRCMSIPIELLNLSMPTPNYGSYDWGD